MPFRNPIFQSISNWFERTFADPEAINLFMTLVISILIFEFFGAILMPVIVSIILAYLLHGAVRRLVRWRVPRLLAVWMVYIIFLSVFIYAIFYFIPIIWRQLTILIVEMPHTFIRAQLFLSGFLGKHPWIFSDDQLNHIMGFFREQAPKFGHNLIRLSWMALPNLAELILYLVLVPLLVFFFLKDYRKIVHWLKQFLPKRHSLVKQVSVEVYNKIGSYVKGRIIEIIIVGVVSILIFTLLGLQYSFLIGALVGLSVIVPYIGAIIVTIPVVAVGLMEWGFTPSFWYLIIAFSLIIAIDGNILFPLLFAHKMDLHPIVIILAVLVFGGIWGFWGVFFAIPLATLVNAILKVWPRVNLIDQK